MGIGIDVVDVEDVEESVARFGDHYLRRVFTPREVAACAHGANARRLAARFAAKEATLKTFIDEDRAVGWRSVEVHLPARGAAAVELYRRGRRARPAPRYRHVRRQRHRNAAHVRRQLSSPRAELPREEVTGEEWKTASGT